ncbi:MAG TPA: hypothetical protein VFK78_07775 [Gemmatimonadales bacterium]|nr:hypothetical protein [Gemmatimonadales bacterium]
MAPKHEFGVDLAAFWASQSFGGVSASNFNITTPVDVRVGFVSSGAMQFEPRLSFTFATAQSGGQSSHAIAPDLNVLFGLGKAKAHNDNKYFTAGVGANLVGLGGVSYTQLTVNGGIGMRSPYESGAFRLEAFVAYATKNTSKGVPSTLAIGARIGLSLWH